MEPHPARIPIDDCPICGGFGSWEKKLIFHLYPATGRVFWHVAWPTLHDGELPHCAGWSRIRQEFMGEPPRRKRLVLHGPTIYAVYGI